MKRIVKIIITSFLSLATCLVFCGCGSTSSAISTLRSSNLPDMYYTQSTALRNAIVEVYNKFPQSTQKELLNKVFSDYDSFLESQLAPVLAFDTSTEVVGTTNVYDINLMSVSWANDAATVSTLSQPKRITATSSQDQNKLTIAVYEEVEPSEFSIAPGTVQASNGKVTSIAQNLENSRCQIRLPGTNLQSGVEAFSIKSGYLFNIFNRYGDDYYMMLEGQISGWQKQLKLTLTKSNPNNINISDYKFGRTINSALFSFEITQQKGADGWQEPRQSIIPYSNDLSSVLHIVGIA